MRFIKLENVELESGSILEEVEVAYEKEGKDGAEILFVCHALTGNQHAAGNAEAGGWWSGLIGPERPIDLNSYQIITMNILGSCYGTTGPRSLKPSTGKPYLATFPFFTVRDIVNVHHLALIKLGVTHVKGVIGGSLGGMQALEFAIMYPDFMDTVVCLAATPVFSDYALAFNELGRQAILQDPLWKNGRYDEGGEPKEGLKLARMVGMVTYRTEPLFEKRFNRQEKDGWGHDHTETAFEVAGYLQYQGEKFIERFDANSYLYLLKAMDSHDIGRDRDGWERAITEIKAPMFGVGFSNDLLYPPAKIKEMIEVHKNHQPGSVYMLHQTAYGHDGFLMDFEGWGIKLKEWLNDN